MGCICRDSTGEMGKSSGSKYCLKRMEQRDRGGHGFLSCTGMVYNCPCIVKLLAPIALGHTIFASLSILRMNLTYVMTFGSRMKCI